MDHLKLRRLCDKDIPLFKKWLYQDYVAKWYEHPLDWLDEIEKRKGEFSFVHHLIAEYEGREIGFCQYYEYRFSGEDWHNNIELDGTYSIDYMIGEAEYLGRGIGREIIKTLTKLLFSLENAARVIVQPDDENKASRNALLSAGYEYDKANDLYIIKKIG